MGHFSMPRPKRVSSIADLGLSQNLIDQIKDLQEAHLGAPEHRVIARALEWYFAKGINDDPPLRERFEEARKARLSAKTR
jgi:hypothetical protein